MRPSPVDRLFQFAYRGAYLMMRVYWRLRRPSTHGSLVAVWHDQRLLLVRNSYVPYYSLPGGYVKADETGRDAAVRELSEEIGLRVDPDMLSLALSENHEWEQKHERIEIFELESQEAPRVEVDHREVVDAAFFSPESALKLDLFPPIRTVIERRLARRN